MVHERFALELRAKTYWQELQLPLRHRPRGPGRIRIPSPAIGDGGQCVGIAGQQEQGKVTAGRWRNGLLLPVARPDGILAVQPAGGANKEAMVPAGGSDRLVVAVGGLHGGVFYRFASCTNGVVQYLQGGNGTTCYRHGQEVQRKRKDSARIEARRPRKPKS